MANDLVTVIAQGTMRAAVLIAESKGATAALRESDKMDAMLASMRQQVTAGYAELLADLAVANGMSDAMGRAFLNATCNIYALRALQEAGVIEEVLSDILSPVEAVAHV